METTRQITLESNDLAQSLFGEHSRNLKRIEELASVGIRSRGNVVDIQGQEPGVLLAERLIRELSRLIKRGYSVSESDIEPAKRMLEDDPEIQLDRVYRQSHLISGTRKSIHPKSLAQKNYLEAIKTNDIAFAVGPAGTGKTYLAMAMAVSALARGEVGRIILTRLGFDSRAVITGDVTQIDLPAGERSGLKHARTILEGIPGISFSEFTDKDVVRHPLVQKIILAYERCERQGAPSEETRDEIERG